MSNVLEIGDFRFHLDYQVVLFGLVESADVEAATVELEDLFNGGVDVGLVPDSLVAELGKSLDVPITSMSEVPKVDHAVGDFETDWDLVDLVHYQTQQLQSGNRLLVTSVEHAKSSRRLIELNKFLAGSASPV